jgi:DnaK suppressor protein
MIKKDYKSIVLPPKYAPKKTEKYMSDQQKAFFYQMLLKEQETLVAEIKDAYDGPHLGQKLDGIGAMDEGDIAALSVETDLSIKKQERNIHYLKSVDFALKRLEDGTYGYSVLSGAEIGLKRLMVSPVATMTVEEKEERDRHKKHL